MANTIIQLMCDGNYMNIHDRSCEYSIFYTYVYKHIPREHIEYIYTDVSYGLVSSNTQRAYECLLPYG